MAGEDADVVGEDTTSAFVGEVLLTVDVDGVTGVTSTTVLTTLTLFVPPPFCGLDKGAEGRASGDDEGDSLSPSLVVLVGDADGECEGGATGGGKLPLNGGLGDVALDGLTNSTPTEPILSRSSTDMSVLPKTSTP